MKIIQTQEKIGFLNDSGLWLDRVLKIVQVGDFFFNAKKKSPSQFQTGGKLQNGFIRNGHQVIAFPYRDIGRRGIGKYFAYARQAQIEQHLEHLIFSSQPDLLLLAASAPLSAKFLKGLVQNFPKMKIAQWSDDALFEGKNVQKIQQKHPFCTATFLSTAPSLARDVLGVKKNIFYLPPPVDLSVETARNFEKEILPKMIFLSCGNSEDKRLICGQSWSMTDFLNFLSENLPREMEFSLAGVGRTPYCTGSAYHEKLKQAAVGLNFSRKGDELLYSSDRIAHIVGNGLLCAQERASGFDRFFSEEEMLFFSSKEELLEKLVFFWRHPKERQNSAKKGWKKYQSLFSERKLAAYILQAAFGRIKTEMPSGEPRC